MAKQVNRTMIGGFVVLAVILLAVSLVIFGSGKFFKKTNKFVLYFDESIKGLAVGAPVLFQGVQVGSVSEIVIRADFRKLKADIPVYIEVEPDRFQVVGTEFQDRKPGDLAPRLIELGLRATLTMQSFITGQLLIELDFHPNTPVVLRHLDPGMIEIPTLPSTSAKLAQALERIDLGTLQQKLEAGLDGLQQFITNPDLIAGLRELRQTLQSTNKLIARVDRQVQPLSTELQKITKEFGRLAVHFDNQMESLVTGLNKTMTAARRIMSEDAPLLVQLESTMQELAAMSRSLRQLTDYLDQHPEALIRGKGKAGGNNK